MERIHSKGSFFKVKFIDTEALTKIFPAIKSEQITEYNREVRDFKRSVYNPWHLDTHSTILSRKCSFHKVEGNLKYVKTRHVTSINRRKSMYYSVINFLLSFLHLGKRNRKKLVQTASRIRANNNTGELEYIR